MPKDYSLYEYLLLRHHELAMEAINTIEPMLPELLAEPDEWNTYKVIHDDPEVWRIWRQVGNIRVCFHKIYPCDDPFMHPHPWPSIVKCLKGGYQNTIGVYNGPKEDVMKLKPQDLDAFTSSLVRHSYIVVPGSIYSLVDIREFHAVKAQDINWSLMLMDKPHFPGATQQFSRKAPIDSKLSVAEKDEMMAFARSKYPLV